MWRILLDTTKKNWKNEKQSKKFIYKLSIYFININITLNLKMKKQILYCCFTWKVFTELNFAVVFLLIRRTWEDPFACEVGGWGILRNGGDWHSFTDYKLYIWPYGFEEIALQVSRGNSSLNFPYSEQHLLIQARSHPPTGQIKSPR